MRVAPEIILRSQEQAELTKLVRSRLTGVRLAQRARIVLLAAQGLQNKAIAVQMGVGRVQVARWRQEPVGLGNRRLQIDRSGPFLASPHFARTTFLVET